MSLGHPENSPQAPIIERATIAVLRLEVSRRSLRKCGHRTVRRSATIMKGNSPVELGWSQSQAVNGDSGAPGADALEMAQTNRS
jgi:hypothetical protein